MNGSWKSPKAMQAARLSQCPGEGGDDQGVDVEETWGGRLWATVSGSWFPPGFHLVRKEGEVEVLFLERMVIPLGGR